MYFGDVKKLKDGDEIIFVHPFPAYTVGKKYKVKTSDIGVFVESDTAGFYYLMKPKEKQDYHDFQFRFEKKV